MLFSYNLDKQEIHYEKDSFWIFLKMIIDFIFTSPVVIKSNFIFERMLIAAAGQDQLLELIIHFIHLLIIMLYSIYINQIEYHKYHK